MLQLLANDDALQVTQGSQCTCIPYQHITAVWIVRVGDGFAGSDQYYALIGTGNSVIPIMLEHHTQWQTLRPVLQRALENGQLYRVEADRLPKAWYRYPWSRMAAVRARPVDELAVARERWTMHTMTAIPDTMP